MGCKDSFVWKKVVPFGLVVCLELADLVSDWLLWCDVSIAEQGLVYGPPDDKAVNAMLFFAILGVVVFCFELPNLAMDSFRGEAWVNVDLVTAISIWIEDVPQFAINVYIAHCREDPASIFQMSKATLGVLALIFKIIYGLVRYCSKEKQEEAEESKANIVYRVFTMLGLFFNFACAITIFVFTQTQKDLNGNIYFQIPNSVFEDRYNDERYFQNVSVYFHHSTFDYARGSDNSSLNWMRLIRINTVRDLPDLQVLFDYEYQDDTTELRMALWENNNGTWTAQECYRIFKGNGTVEPGSPDMRSCSSFLSGPHNSIIFLFNFRPPDRVFRRLIFGDIVFNATINVEGNCSAVSNITDSSDPSRLIPAIHYYRTATGETRHLVQETSGRARFYQASDLTDIKEVWQTGWGDCPSSGSLAPHQASLDAPCDRV